MGRKAPDLSFRDDVDIKLLRKFAPTHDWVLAPGDMLYLPPLVPHHGVAEDPCLTFSVGMRAPSSAELIGDYLDTLIEDADEAIRYHDEDLQVQADPYEIDDAAMRRAIEALNALRINDADKLGDWFGRFITTYRASGEVAPPPELPERAEIEAAFGQGLMLERFPWARLAWRKASKGATLFCSGLDLPVGVTAARLLAPAETVDGKLYARLSAKGRDAVWALVQAGFYQPATEPDED